VKFTSRDFHTNGMRSGAETVLAMKSERWVVQHGILSAAHPTGEKKELGTITFRVDVEKLNNAAPLKVPILLLSPVPHNETNPPILSFDSMYERDVKVFFFWKDKEG